MLRVPVLPLRVLPFVLLVHYLLFGMQLGATGVLWSELRHGLGLSDGAFGMVLLVTPLVGFLLLSAGAIVRDRFDRRTLAVAGLMLSAAGIAGVAFAPNLLLLLAARLLCGLGYGLNDAAVMGAALAWERERRSSLVGRLYAAFSLGAVLGALASGWLLSAGWGYSAVLGGLVPLGLLMAGIAALTPYAYGAGPAQQPGVLQPIPWRNGIVALAVLSLGGALVEALIGGWLVIRLRELGAGPLAASMVYAASDVALILGRLAAPALERRLGAQRALGVAMTLIMLGAGGVAVGAVAGSAVAFVLIGLGVALVAPLVLSLSRHYAPDAGDAVARMLLAAGYLGFMIAGPLAGFLADWFTVRLMLAGTIAALGLIIGGMSVLLQRSSRGRERLNVRQSVG